MPHDALGVDEELKGFAVKGDAIFSFFELGLGDPFCLSDIELGFAIGGVGGCMAESDPVGRHLYSASTSMVIL